MIEMNGENFQKFMEISRRVKSWIKVKHRDNVRSRQTFLEIKIENKWKTKKMFGKMLYYLTPSFSIGRFDEKELVGKIENICQYSIVFLPILLKHWYNKKYIFKKYTFKKYTFRKYTFKKYTFGKYTF